MSPPHQLVTLFAALSLSIFTADDALAQAVVVQQPVIQQFGVSTAVSVPDRGAVLLGSVGSSQSFSRRYGPIGIGPNFSRQAQQQSVWVQASIHDFQAMDAALLSAAEAAADRRNPPPLTGMAANACNQLLRQHRQSSQQPQPLPDRKPTSQAAAGSGVSRLGRFSLR